MILTERKEIAQALNFGKYPVLTYDLDRKKGCAVKATKNSNRYGKMDYKCELFFGDGEFYLLTHATCISANFGLSDVLESAEYANAPTVDSNQEVAIVVHSRELNIYAVHIVKSGKVDPTYATATEFKHVGN